MKCSFAALKIHKLHFKHIVDFLYVKTFKTNSTLSGSPQSTSTSNWIMLVVKCAALFHVKRCFAIRQTSEHGFYCRLLAKEPSEVQILTHEFLFNILQGPFVLHNLQGFPLALKQPERRHLGHCSASHIWEQREHPAKHLLLFSTFGVSKFCVWYIVFWDCIDFLHLIQSAFLKKCFNSSVIMWASKQPSLRFLKQLSLDDEVMKLKRAHWGCCCIHQSVQWGQRRWFPKKN